MTNIGDYNAAHGSDASGLRKLKAVHWNLEAPRLYEEALARGEGQLARGGAFVATTGSHTGRSPKDKFVVRDATTENQIWWDNNGAITPEQFETLYADFLAHAEGRELFAQDLRGGADPAHGVNARVFTELAWHSLFIRNLLIRPDRATLGTYVPELTIIDLPSFQAEPHRHGCRSKTVIAIDFARKLVLIGGSAYAGEMKKSVFTYLNYTLPGAGVMPMHCSANAALDEAGDSALFFGLSGTGKTTLSNDSSRQLLGDDEHGWSRQRRLQLRGRLLRQDHPPLAQRRTGDLRHHRALRHGDGERGDRPRDPRAGFRRRLAHREHPLRLPPRLHRERQRHGAGRAPEEHRHADLRRVRRDAADRPADGRRGDCTTSCPATPPRSPARSGA